MQEIRHGAQCEERQFMNAQNCRDLWREGALSRRLSRFMHHKIEKLSDLIATSVYQAAAHVIVPGGDANHDASEARIPRSDKGTRSSAEAEEDASAATMLTIAWTGGLGTQTTPEKLDECVRRNSMSAGKQNHDSSSSRDAPA